VVAALGFFQLGKVGVEFLLVEERRGVESLQLLPRGVALPIGPGHGEQLEGLADVAGAGDVPAATEVDEFALPVKRQARLTREAGLDVLDLELLAEFLAEFERFGPRHFDPLELLVRGDDLLHLCFDLRKIFLGDRLRQREVVIEAGGGGRPECQLHAVVEPHHGLGHHVGRAVPHHGERFGILLGEQPQLHFAGGR
jgi:hypothetical protein